MKCNEIRYGCIWKDAHRLYANTTPFSISDLSICRFQLSDVDSGTKPSWIPSNNCKQKQINLTIYIKLKYNQIKINFKKLFDSEF